MPPDVRGGKGHDRTHDFGHDLPEQPGHHSLNWVIVLLELASNALAR